MAETQPKRLREEENSSSELDANSKRQKPYTNIILDLLEEEEPSQEPSHELSQGLSAILTTLQQELSSPTSFDSLHSTEPDLSCHLSSSAGDESAESVMRHLLEASDDELGIPKTGDENNDEGLNNFPFGLDDNGLWEIEDEAANYYTVLQAELFM